MSLLFACRAEPGGRSAGTDSAASEVAAAASAALTDSAAADTSTTVNPALESAPSLPGQGGVRQWTGDLDEMLARGRIRVLVTLSRTNFFIDRGKIRGVTPDRFEAFEAELSKRAKPGQKAVHIVFVPVVRDELLPALIAGRGDIAAANLSITEQRLREVDFSAPLRTGVNEVLVTGPSSPPIQSLGDLAGTELFIRRSSSYFESVHRVNDSLKQAGRKPIVVEPADERLEDEDILEMVNAGLVPATVVDDHVANLWSGVLDSVAVHPAITFATGGQTAWAIRKHSPGLKAATDAFAKTHAKGTTFGNIIDKRYWRDAGYITNPAAKAQLARFRSMVALFRKYGAQYGFDYLLLGAQAYQESGLDQSRRSHVGAIGVMQVMPKTASDPNVGITGIDKLEPNIQAGTKYMRFIMDRYFKGEPMDSLNRALFAFASYNAGPARVAKLRAKAKDMGLDPNVWFNNVEVVAARDIGRETVTYVRNIYKYYVAYSLVVQHDAARRGAVEAKQGSR